MSDSDDDTVAVSENKSKLIRLSDWLKHPVVTVLLTFTLSGIVGTVFTKWLDHIAQARDLRTALRTHATDSIKDVTNVLYERRTRGEMLASSVKRQSSIAEITERKHAYDDIYVKYNSNLQSDTFRINEFASAQFPFFDVSRDEISLKLPSH